MESRFERGLCLLDVLDVPEVMRCVLLCMLEAVEFSKFAGVSEVLGMLEVIRCALLCMLEDTEVRHCLLEVLEVMRCVLLCMREGALEAWRCAPGVQTWQHAGMELWRPL